MLSIHPLKAKPASFKLIWSKSSKELRRRQQQKAFCFGRDHDTRPAIRVSAASRGAWCQTQKHQVKISLIDSVLFLKAHRSKIRAAHAEELCKTTKDWWLLGASAASETIYASPFLQQD